MTTDQTVDKLLLDYRAELEGMVAENKVRYQSDSSPMYGEDAFAELSQRYADRFQKA